MKLPWLLLLVPAVTGFVQPRRPEVTTQLASIPNPLDTITSGLASICRLPRGITAVETPPTPDGQLDILPRFCKLWDIETNSDCRPVRELLTELDVVVDLVIPATSDSQVFTEVSYEHALNPGTEIPVLQVQESNGEELVLTGKEQIVSYLECIRQDLREQNGIEAKTADSDLEEYKEIALGLWNTVGNGLANMLRWGRGTEVISAATTNNAPKLPLVLYSYEGNQFCRLVREVLTELDLVYELRSAGKKSSRRSELAYITGGSSQCPYLIDPNTGVDMAESSEIIEYLYANYARWTPPNELLEWTSRTLLPLLKPVYQVLAPLQAGSKQPDSYDQSIGQANQVIEDTIQQNPVVVYTYELSPFCSEATALLDRLDIPYREVSLGKEWIPGLISPEGASIRAALLERTGQSSLPHVFVGARSIGGLFSGTPGLLEALKEGRLQGMVEASTEILEKRRRIQRDSGVGAFE